MDRFRLVRILNKTIEDKSFTDNIHKMYNAGILFKKEIHSETTGIHQGNILSPLLYNIYLTELDTKVEEVINKKHRGKHATINQDYVQAVALVGKEKNRPEAERRRLRHYKKLKAFKAGLRYTQIDSEFIRVKYIRYADDFLIGVRGPKELATSIRKDITHFLKSNLKLIVNEEKTRLTNTYHEKAHFLGTTIHNVAASKCGLRGTQTRQQQSVKNKQRILGFIQGRYDRQAKLFRDQVIKAFKSGYRSHTEAGTLSQYKEKYMEALRIIFNVKPSGLSVPDNQEESNIPPRYQVFGLHMARSLRDIDRLLIAHLIQFCSDNFLAKTREVLKS